MSAVNCETMEIGDKVKDLDGNVGIVVNCSDIHNVEVKINGQEDVSLFCLDENCDYYDYLVIIE